MLGPVDILSMEKGIEAQVSPNCPFPLAGGRLGWGSGLSAGTAAGQGWNSELKAGVTSGFGGALERPTPIPTFPLKGGRRRNVGYQHAFLGSIQMSDT